MKYDYIVIGGGIVGASTAWQLQQRCPDKKIVLLEKEATPARHQTGHNSGVIHAGVYYEPGSLKAKFCRQGAQATMAFCRDNDIAFEQCGKLIVATTDAEYQGLLALHQRCGQNDIEAELLTQQQLNALEPNICGIGAIKVSQTGIVNYRQVCQVMVDKFIALGGEVRYNSQVKAIDESSNQVVVTVNQLSGKKGDKGGKSQLEGAFVIACGGLMADRLTAMMGIITDFQIVPYRGEYYQLPERHNNIVNHLIYPVPDPQLPFLGVHLTRMIDGSVTVGPNAVQGFKREGYGRFNVSLRDSVQMLTFKGFWQVAKKHWKSGLIETKNAWWKPGYLKLVQKYCPQLKVSDLQPYPAGIRAQAVLSDGTLVHDFLFAHSSRSLHVCNAPSPAATAAIPIGGYICDKVLRAC
ncbi:MAG: L-2-hydroxyglutarate oxidase [Phenylobacterium sp.]|jgi:L-2-hydroxyglutarate oxidase